MVSKMSYCSRIMVGHFWARQPLLEKGHSHDPNILSPEPLPMLWIGLCRELHDIPSGKRLHSYWQWPSRNFVHFPIHFAWWIVPFRYVSPFTRPGKTSRNRGFTWIYLDLPIENGDIPHKSPFSHGFSSFFYQNKKACDLAQSRSLGLSPFLGHPQLTFQGFQGAGAWGIPRFSTSCMPQGTAWN